MLHDLILCDATDNATLGIAKIDLTLDRQDVGQKNIIVNHFSFMSYDELDPRAKEKIQLQFQVERLIPATNHLMQDVLDNLTSIDVIATLDGVTLNAIEA